MIMKTYILPALKITLSTALLFGIIYPLFIAGIAHFIAPDEGDGEVIELNSKKIGFVLLGQSFSSERYFNSRPSAVNYNAASTGGSNKGPGNPDYLKQVEERINDILKTNPGISKKEIPIDIITASGGGLDPHISPQAAMFQIQRIAKARGLSEEKLKVLVDRHIQRPLFGLLGPSTVHVLYLNLDLDQLH